MAARRFIVSRQAGDNKVVQLDSYRSSSRTTGDAVASVAADEQATGAQLVTTWTDAVIKYTDPTMAHLSELAAAVDDVLEADSFESQRAALLQIANGARAEMAERLRRGRR
jgi:hypothetical protein